MPCRVTQQCPPPVFIGVFRPEPDIPAGWKWFYQVTYYHRAVQPMVLSIVHDTDQMVKTDSTGMFTVSEEVYMNQICECDR